MNLHTLFFYVRNSFFICSEAFILQQKAVPLQIDLDLPRPILELMAKLGKSAENIKKSMKAAKVKKVKENVPADVSSAQTEEQLRKTEHRRFMYTIKTGDPEIRAQYEQLQFKEKEKFRKMWVADPDWSFAQQFKSRSAAKINQNAAVEASYMSVGFEVFVSATAVYSILRLSEFLCSARNQ